jgi:hypothetical protein
MHQNSDKSQNREGSRKIARSIQYAFSSLLRDIEAKILHFVAGEFSEASYISGL